MLGMWGCWGCGILGMWEVRDVECWGCGMFGMWDVGCRMFAGMWDIDSQNAAIKGTSIEKIDQKLETEPVQSQRWLTKLSLF